MGASLRITKASLPFAEYICGVPDGAPGCASGRAPGEYKLPAYIQTGMRLLLKTKVSSSQQAQIPPEDENAISNVPISSPWPSHRDYTCVVHFLGRYDLSLLLKTQAQQEQIAPEDEYALSNTFVKIKLVEILLSNAFKSSAKGHVSRGREAGSAMGPILCVCFTNHALDEFLEGIIASGIKKVVRVGKRCKSEVLQGQNLLNIIRTSNVDRSQGLADPWPTSGRKRRKLVAVWVGEVRATAAAAIEAEVDKYAKAVLVVWCEGRCWWCGVKGGAGSVVWRAVLALWCEGRCWWAVLVVWCEGRCWWCGVKGGAGDVGGAGGVKGGVGGKKGSAGGVRERSELQQMEDLQVLKRAQVVDMITSGVAKMQRLITALNPQVIIVEEAAEVLEAHILTSLIPLTQHVILIGDHKQLCPKVEVYDLSKDSHRGFDLDISLFECLALSRQIPVYTLATHRRMRPEIADLIRYTIYHRLTDHLFVHGYPDVQGMAVNLHFWDHGSPESGRDDLGGGKSKSNAGEAAMVVGLVTYLLQQGYTGGDITILTPYVGQLLKLRQALSQVVDVRLGEGDAEEESTVIIISLVRHQPDGDIGFLKSPNRTNVLLSRAKHGMYLIGACVARVSLVSAWRVYHCASSTRAATSKASLWPRIMGMLDRKGHVKRFIPLRCASHAGMVTHIQGAGEFKEKASEGRYSTHSLWPHLPPQASNVPCFKARKPSSISCWWVQLSHLHGRTVKVTMPLCGNEQEVRCGEAPTTLTNPKRCTACCGALISDSYGHACMSLCTHCIVAPAANTDQCLLPPTLPPDLLRLQRALWVELQAPGSVLPAPRRYLLPPLVRAAV
ncbi:unnamed protein product [Closterium sp. NIES-64]|nr:unnamed protein product [Closterium sp. NIES-64]